MAHDTEDGILETMKAKGPSSILSKQEMQSIPNEPSGSSSRDDPYLIEDKAPSPQEYYNLRKESGLTPPSTERVEAALNNSIFAVTIRTKAEGEAVAMGRIIGDAGVFYFVTDVATLPHHQRRGLGSRIFRRLLTRLDAEAPRDAFVCLLADPPGVNMYLRHGFAVNHTETPMYRLESAPRTAR